MACYELVPMFPKPSPPSSYARSWKVGATSSRSVPSSPRWRRSISTSWAFGRARTVRPADALVDRLDHPAPRVVRDAPQPPAAHHDPRPADPPDGGAPRRRQSRRRAGAAGRDRAVGPRPEARMGRLLAEGADRGVRGAAVPRVLP